MGICETNCDLIINTHLHSGKNTMLKSSTSNLDLGTISCLPFKNVRAGKFLSLNTFSI